MATRTRSNLRGLRDIRTQSGRVDRSDVPYMAYMKISSLEMEKARRGQERSSAKSRIDNIDTRMAEIDREKSRLLARLAQRERRPAADGRVEDEGPTKDCCDNKPKGFRIRY